MSTEAFPVDGREYRHSRLLLELGIAGTLLFGGADIFNVVTALVNADGSSKNPVVEAVVLGFGYSCITLIPLYLIMAFLRHRLFVSRELVRVTGCFRTREVRLANVTKAVWKSLFKDGAIVLYQAGGHVKIGFGNYTIQERLELIQFFRAALAEHIQHGWERFEPLCIPVPVDYDKTRLWTRGFLRFNVIAWTTAMPAMYAILIWQKLADLFPRLNWGIVILLPLVMSGGIIYFTWLVARFGLAEARRREDIG